MQKLLRLPDVLERVPLSRSQLYIEMDRGRFPRPVKISERINGWPEAEVAAWVASRIEAREAA